MANNIVHTLEKHKHLLIAVATIVAIATYMIPWGAIYAKAAASGISQSNRGGAVCLSGGSHFLSAVY